MKTYNDTSRRHTEPSRLIPDTFPPTDTNALPASTRADVSISSRFTGRGRSSRTASNLGAFLALLFVVLSAGCGGIVMEPADGDYVAEQANVDFRGYAATRGASVAVEVQNSSRQFVAVATTTASTTPTYIEGKTGYYFEVTVPRWRLSRYQDGSGVSVRVIDSSSGYAFQTHGGRSPYSFDSAVSAWEGMAIAAGPFTLETQWRPSLRSPDSSSLGENCSNDTCAADARAQGGF